MSEKIRVKITKKQYDLLKFIEDELPYGEFKLKTHAGQPAGGMDLKPKKVFGEESGIVDRMELDNVS